MEAHGEGRKLRQGERWHRRRVRKYLRRVDHFRELLLLCVHWTGGQPARGTEITSIRFRNGYMQDRNVLRDSRTLGRGHSISQERFAIRSAEGRPALFGIAGRTAASGISRVRTAAGRAARRRR